MVIRLDPDGAEEKAIHELVDIAGKDVLEIGCGSGRVTRVIAPLGRSVLAFDVKEGEIAAAISELPASLRSKVEFRVGDVTTASIPPASYDLAVYSNSL